MKQTLLTLALMFLPMLASADAVEIDGIYYNLDTEAKTAEVTQNPNEYSGSVAIPEKVQHEGTEYSVTSIGKEAFRNCIGLTSITIPNSVTSIGESAFDNCSGLTSITIPNSVTSIGDWAFYYCSGLTSITIPNSVTSVGVNAFSKCRRLTSIEVESGNTKYDSRDNCNAIIETESNTLIAGCQNTTIPNSVTSIGGSAFWGCSGLTSITIPNSVTSIGYNAFNGCTGLTSVTIPNSVTSIGNVAFNGCDGLTSITIPNSVTSIGKNAFGGCSGLTSITIPNSVTSIEDYAFNGCSGLTSITIPNNVTSIGVQAFMRCSGLTSITIPNSVTSIGAQAFFGCSSLLDMFCYAENVPETGFIAFYESNVANATLHVPAESIGSYQATEPWNQFKAIVALGDEGAEIAKYDLNNDGVVDAADIIVLVNYIAGKK